MSKTPDTKEDNILFVLPDIDSEIARQAGKRLWETKNIQVPGFYKGPFVSSRSLNFSRRISLNSTQVKLVDFGSGKILEAPHRLNTFLIIRVA